MTSKIKTHDEVLKTDSAADCQAEADRCLNKAVQFEEDEKTAKMVDLMLDRAVTAENATLDGRE